jgi:hypothetical protein
VPYGVEDVAFDSGGARLPGSTYLPRTRYGFRDRFHHGSGGTQRRIVRPIAGLAGIAALVYDKRGAGH